MAIVQNPLINRASGSVGTTIFSKYKDKNVIRAKNVFPMPPPSAAQIAQRKKFSDASLVYQLLANFMKTHPIRLPKHLTYLPYFMKNNLKCFSGDSDVVNLTLLQNLKLCRGNFTNYTSPVIQPIAPNNFRCWAETNTHVTPNIYWDCSYFLGFDSAAKEFRFGYNPSMKSAVNFTPYTPNSTIYLFCVLLFRNINTQEMFIGNSFYCGSHYYSI